MACLALIPEPPLTKEARQMARARRSSRESPFSRPLSSAACFTNRIIPHTHDLVADSRCPLVQSNS